MARYWLPALLTAAAVLGAPAMASETVRVGGTGGVLELVRLAAQPLRTNETVRIEVLPSLGTDGALRALAAGAIDIALLARELTPEQTKPGLAAVPFARTPLVFVTSHPDPGPFTSRGIVAVFAAADPRWHDGSRVKLILRPRSEHSNVLLIKSLPGMADAVESARKRPELPIAATDQDSAELAERLPGSLVQAGYGQIVSEKRALRFIALDGISPAAETMAVYPHQQTFYLVYLSSRSDPATKLLAYLRSPSGKTLMREVGFLPVE